VPCHAEKATPAPGHACRAANDNDPKAKTRPRYAWFIYRAVAKAWWIGQVIAHSADEAIEAAAVE
jgi:hypothetical protein